MSEQPVAPADKPTVAEEPEEGTNPVLTNYDQPVFPRPAGVSQEDLEEQGVAHAYAPPPEDDEPTQPEEQLGSDDEGKPGVEAKGADPEAAEKAKAAHSVAEKNKVTAPAPVKDSEKAKEKGQ